MAAPIVSHIAGLVRAYFPKLTAVEVKNILLQSCWKPIDPNSQFAIPQKDQTNTLSNIAAAGGIINAALSIQHAATYYAIKYKK
jgi:hypothetical protein